MTALYTSSRRCTRHDALCTRHDGVVHVITALYTSSRCCTRHDGVVRVDSARAEASLDGASVVHQRRRRTQRRHPAARQLSVASARRDVRPTWPTVAGRPSVAELATNCSTHLRLVNVAALNALSAVARPSVDFIYRFVVCYTVAESVPCKSHGITELRSLKAPDK